MCYLTYKNCFCKQTKNKKKLIKNKYKLMEYVIVLLIHPLHSPMTNCCRHNQHNWFLFMHQKQSITNTNKTHICMK